MPADDLAAAALDRYVERALGPLADRAGATVEEIASLLRLGRSSAYEAARRGDIPIVRVGHRVIVPVPALVALLLGLPKHPDALAGILASITDSDTSATGTSALNAQSDPMH